MLKTASLMPEAKAIIVNKGTEYYFSGIYNDFTKEVPIYVEIVELLYLVQMINLLLILDDRALIEKY